MADKKDEKDEEPEEKGGEGEGGEKKDAPKKPAFKLSDGVVSILKMVLMYLGVAIISFAVAFFVAHSGGGGEKHETKESLVTSDPETGDVIEKIEPGADWALDDMILNTADEDERHMVRVKLIVSYDKHSKTILMGLNDRKTQIHNDILKILGSKKYLEINTTPKQEEVIREIKARIKLIVDEPGIIEVFIKDFTVH